VFERFTDRARRVVVFAQEESRALGHDHIGTEHILLGLLREREGIAGQVLTDLGVDLDQTREDVERIVGRTEDDITGHIPFTPRAKKVMELSLREAIALDHHHIGTEHILLGLMREGDGVAAQVLTKRGVSLRKARTAVLRLTEKHPSPPERPAAAAEQVREGPLCPGCGLRVLAARSREVVAREEPGELGHRVLMISCPRCGLLLGTHVLGLEEPGEQGLAETS
jgi:ATP-dependent Clp protease ATP-binding subunit ClpC